MVDLYLGHEDMKIKAIRCPRCKSPLNSFVYCCEPCFVSLLKEAFEAAREREKVAPGAEQFAMRLYRDFEHWMESKK